MAAVSPVAAVVGRGGSVVLDPKSRAEARPTGGEKSSGAWIAGRVAV